MQEMIQAIGTEELCRAKIPCEETGITVRTGICGFCGGTCLVDAYCKDGKVIKIEGNKSLPMANGRVCVKGAALKQSLYHPDRLLYPMKRIGKRGEGKFERISWDEALDTVAEKLLETKERHGAKATLVYCGHPKWFRPQLTDFANCYGTPNFGTESSTCAYALMMACQSSFGKGVLMPPPDLVRCKALVVWGGNALHSNSVMARGAFLRAVKRGIKLVVVDPRCTPTSEHAHHVSSSCLAGTVNVYHGAGEKDVNLLLDDQYLDPVSGFPGFKSYCCRLEKKEVGYEQDCL